MKSPFHSFASFSIVLLVSYINKPDFSRDLSIFTASSISPFDNINAVIPDSKIFFCIPAPSADAATVSPSGMKMFLVSGLSTFLVNCRPTFIIGTRSLPRNPPVCTNLDS